MGFWSKLGKMMGFEKEYIDEDYIDYDKREESDGYGREPATLINNDRGKVLNIHSSPKYNMMVCKPTTYEDTESVVNSLKNKTPVIINLSKLEKTLAQRVLDFTSGAVYALDGSIKKVDHNVYVAVPNNVEISGNVREKVAERVSRGHFLDYEE